MRFSQEWLKQLKDRVDLLDLVREYTEMHKAGSNLYVGHCPHPNHNDSDASFTVDIKKQTWCCYGCHSDKKNKKQGNYGSDCIAFIEWVFNGKKSWIDCVKYLAEKVNLPLPKDNYDKQYTINYKLAQKYINDMTEDAYEYLYDRVDMNYAKRSKNAITIDFKIKSLVTERSFKKYRIQFDNFKVPELNYDRILEII